MAASPRQYDSRMITGFRALDRRTLLLFAVFVALTCGAYVQAWGFSDSLEPKPPLYDLLEPLPLWSLWLVLMIPMALLNAPLRAVGMDLLAGSGVREPIVSLAYLYVVAT